MKTAIVTDSNSGITQIEAQKDERFRPADAGHH